MSIYLLENLVQPYAWGSRTALAELLGLPRAGAAPQAELWMGAHPRGPSRLSCEGDSLRDRISADPERFLGRAVAARFGRQLPYLFKVLAADEPLSLQAHPSKAQAEAGFAREQAAQVSLSAPERNYHDDNHKPELLCALSPFWALCGFREAPEILALCRELELTGLESLLGELEAEPSAAGVARAFSRIFELSAASRREAIGSLMSGAQRVLQQAGRQVPLESSQLYWAARWSLRIVGLYPDDPGVIAALFLNIVELSPFEAIFLPSGELHAYLGGVGLEIMASSDNVLRGGLTSKRVDVAELMRVLSFEPRRPEIIRGVVEEFRGGREVHYPTEVSEFALSRVELNGSATYTAAAGPEIVLCLEGAFELSRDGAERTLARGASAFCSAAGSGYEVRGQGVLARARVAIS